MKTRFSIVTDLIISRLLIFIAVFVWVRFYIRKLFLSILIAAIITVCISIILSVIFRKRTDRKKTTREREEKKQNILNQFLYNDGSFALDFFHSMLLSKHKADKTPSYLIVDDQILLFTRISLNPLSPNELCGILAAARKINYDKIAVLTYCVHKDTGKILRMFPDMGVDIYDAEMTYSLMEKFNVFPEIKINVKKQKPNIKDALPLIFNRGKVKGYLFSALIMLIGSFFMPFSIYYAVVSSLLIIMSILSYTEAFRPRGYNKRKQYFD